jgi:predicted RNA-binding protein associated with RNAse of E/G family
VRVVSDDERGLLLWTPTGTPLIRQVSLEGLGPRDMTFEEWIGRPKHIIHDQYRGPSALKFNPPGAAYSVWWLFGPSGEFRAWYVNLEEPYVRWAHGIDVTDQDLDIWVWPDRTWEWKDEDELTERLGYPDHYWVPDPDAVWAVGRAVIPAIEAGEFPFDGTWCDFQPDPRWTVPDPMEAGWDGPRVR